MKTRRAIPTLIAAMTGLALIATGCSSGTPSAPAQSEQSDVPAATDDGAQMIVESITYESRGVQVPAIVTIPEGDGDFPLVVMMHGHGGSKDENVGFSTIANLLAGQGIASIRMDFSGSGESEESFAENRLSTMKEDALAGIQVAVADYPIDADRIGGFGYSMGGRLALELMADGAVSFASLALLAPAADTQALIPVFGGEEEWEKLKATAADSPDGYADFTTIYGQEQQLSTGWFTDLEARSVESLIEAAAANAPSRSTVIYAVDDDVVPPAVAKTVAEGLGSEIVTVPMGGHGYGFYDEVPGPVLDMVTSSVTAFFAATLKG